MHLPSRSRRNRLVDAYALVVVAVLFWLGFQADEPGGAYAPPEPGKEYYNLLVDGFLDGSTALQIPVHPDLLSPDPAVRRTAPYLLDATLYQGKYYLYYGVVPAVAFFTPARLLTALNLAPGLAIACSLALGYLAAVAVWRRAHHLYFPSLGSIGHLAFLSLLGFETATPFAITRAAFYEVPIAAGYACCMLGLLALWRTFHAATGRGRLMNLGQASLALGLAVGCRPNYLLVLPVLLGAALWLRRPTRSSAELGSLATLLAGAVLPAILVGVALGAYNFARFGRPWEFGFNYGVNAFFTSGNALFDWSFVGANFNWAYLTPPGISPYFPYIFPVTTFDLPAGYSNAEQFHGQFPVTLLACWILAGTALWLRRRPEAPLGAFIITTLAIGTVSLVFTLLLGIRANRYIVDFQPCFVLSLALIGGLIWSRSTRPGIGFKFWQSGVLGLIMAGVAVNVFGAIQQFGQFAAQRPQTSRWLAEVLDPLVRASIRPFHTLPKPGPVKLTATFPSVTKPTTLPLLVVGLPGFTDGLYAVVQPDHRVEFFFDHHAYGGPHGRPILLQPGKPHDLEVDLGSFYPPAHDAYFASYDVRARDRIKNLATLKIDGELVIDEAMLAYDAPPWTMRLGDNPAALGPRATRFSGRLEGPIRLPNPHSSRFEPPPLRDGIWSIDVEFAMPAIGSNQPILVSGITGGGNLLFARVVDAETIKLGVDIWGYGAPLSPPIKLKTPGRHRFDIIVGTLANDYPWPAPPAALESFAHHFVVWIDGTPAWVVPVAHHEKSYQKVRIGVNQQGFDSAHTTFSGEITETKQPAAGRRAILERLESLPKP